MPIVFAAISPHAPIFLPTVGSKEDREKVKQTLESLDSLSEKSEKASPELIIISSPHQEWGFDVPLHFIAPDFKGEIKKYLTGLEEPSFYFEEGKRFYQSEILNLKSKISLIASGDMSHCLKEDGPYGFHPDGPKFDKDLIELLKNKNIERIFDLDDDYPNAGECGLRSFCFMLGILEVSGINYKPEILSYEGPFGVGYLTANFKLK